MAKKKKMKYIGAAFLLVLFGFLVFYMRKQSTEEAVSVSGFKLNTAIQITAYGLSDESVLDEAMELCDQYEQIFSRTRADSEVYRLNHGTLPQKDGWYVLSEECAELIAQGLYYSELSGGAFDITIAPVSSLWDFTAEDPKVPDAQAINAAKQLVDYRKVELNGNLLRFAKEGMGIELGAIAKGYIADRMKEFLIAEGVENAIIDLGGNILCIGERPDGEAFRVGIQKPFAKRSETIAVAEIRNRSVVSSGIYERCFEKDGILYHHILDPKSGDPYENDLVSVTILSEQSVDGDALSTTCFALGLEKGMDLIDTLEDVQAVFITEDGELHLSEDFDKNVIWNEEK